MSEQDDMVTEFYSQVNDDFYPLIMEGTELLGEGNLQQGIEVLSRPLHTIKGVTGFMSGFETVSSFTHHVESYLKKLQAGELDERDEFVTLGVQAVLHVFQLLDQIQEQGVVDADELAGLESRLEQAASGDAESPDAGLEQLEIEEADGVLVLHVGMPRVHLAPQRASLREALESVRDAPRLRLDLSQVRSMSPRSFEILELFAQEHELELEGMSAGCRATYYAWGFDQSLHESPCLEQGGMRHEEEH